MVKTSSSNNPSAGSGQVPSAGSGQVPSAGSGQAGSPLRSKSTAGQAKPAKSMADLMSSYKTSFKTYVKSDLVKGKVIKLTKNEILVDIQAKSVAVVLEKDKTLLNSLLSLLKEGDEVEVSILNPESDMGNPVVSLRRFLSNKSWGKIEELQKEEKQMDVKVTDVTKGGVVVATESGLTGFLPNSHIIAGENLIPGKTIKVRPIEVNRVDNKIIFSQKVTISQTDFDGAVKHYKTGEVVSVIVMNIVPFGIFVSLAVPGMKNADGKELNLDGLVHISEIAWEKTEDVSRVFSSGDQVEAKIIGFDRNTRRVDLSVKKLSVDPFEKLVEQYPVDKKVTTTVLKMDEIGAHLELQDPLYATGLGLPVEGLIRKDKIPPSVTYSAGQTVIATVSEVDKKRRRIYLVPVLLEKPIGYR